MRLRTRRGPSIGLLVLLGASGCGAANGDVTGTVAYRGKPVCSGSVMILTGEGVARYADITGDGTFAVAAVPLGPVTVTVASPNPNRPVFTETDSWAKLPAKPRTAAAAAPGWFPLPPRFADPGRSGLAYKVVRGANHWAIALPD